jgi:hypothetical protein
MARLIIQPDESVGKDTFIRNSTAATYNYGVNAGLHCGYDSGYIYRSLIYFDMSQLHMTAVVTSARLRFLTAHTLAADGTVDVYRLKTSWGEGAGNHTVATTGESSWNCSVYPTAWQTAGAFGANDCEQSYLAQATVPMTTSSWCYVYPPIDKIQEYINGVMTNNGFLIRNTVEDGESFIFYPSNVGVSVEYRPTFRMDYYIPPVFLFGGQ